jgi:hypothetical protein
MSPHGHNGTGPLTVRVSREADFEAFDRLPPEVRHALNNAAFKYVASEIAIQVRSLGPERVAELMPLVDQRTLEKEAARG